MLPKSVSPWFVQAVVWPVTISLVFLGISLMRSLGFPGIQGISEAFIFGLAYCLAIALLVPGALSALGIQVRSRSVERLTVAGLDREDVVIDDLPIRIYRGQWIIRVMAIVFFLGGLVCLVLASCLVFTWFPPPGPKMDAGEMTIALIGMGFVLTAMAFVVRRCKPEMICEMSEKGVLAPDGFWGRRTFVPWGELSRCEIIHDDENRMVDSFVLWDRAGRHRFKPFKNWWGRLRRSDRNRILRALRARFPQKEKSGPRAEPALAHQASSTLWDPELDG